MIKSKMRLPKHSIIIIVILGIVLSNFSIANGEELEEGMREITIEENNRLKQSKEIKELEGLINNYIDEYFQGYDEKEKIGLVYYDINSGQEISINPNKEFVAASTYKVMINIAVYSEVIKGNMSLDDCIKYKDEDYEDGNTIVDIYSEEGYTIQELLDSSIIYSDNIASRMLFRHLGGFDETMAIASRVLGINISTEGNYETPNNLKVALEYIYNNKDDERYMHLLDVLTQTIYNDRLDKYIPAELVAHKVGMYEGYIHDVGIILTEKPYILSIFTEDIIDGYEFIAGLSKIIYDYQCNIN